jgi:quercetin dioxygenase-like cupin family protein
MSAPGVVTVRLDEVPTLSFASAEEPDWKPLRHHLGVGAFGVNAWVAARAGDVVIERHDEVPDDAGSNGHEELYVVVRGSARFTVGGEPIDAPAGTLVFVSDPGLTREAAATAEDTIVLAIGAARGVAFEPSPWEERSLRELGEA